MSQFRSNLIANNVRRNSYVKNYSKAMLNLFTKDIGKKHAFKKYDWFPIGESIYVLDEILDLLGISRIFCYQNNELPLLLLLLLKQKFREIVKLCNIMFLCYKNSQFTESSTVS